LPIQRENNNGLYIAGGIVIAMLIAACTVLAIFVLSRPDNTQIAKVDPKATATSTPTLGMEIPTTTATPLPARTPTPNAEKILTGGPANNVTASAPPRTAAAEDDTAVCNDGTYTKWLVIGRACSANGGVARWLVTGIDETRKPRAICGDGHISYWGGDRFATCLTGHGVRHWYY
jgi:hypothetical protein